MRSERNLTESRQVSHACSKEHAQVKELEAAVLNVYPVRLSDVPRFRQRRLNYPLSPERFLAVLIEKLLARFAKEMLSNSLLQRPPTLVSLAIDAHQLSLVVVEISVKKLWDDMGIPKLAFFVAESAARHFDET